MNFLEALKEKVLIFDGAMGSSIHQYDLTLDDYEGCENCTDILPATRPDVISEIHESFLKVGCDAIETDSFGGSPVVLAEFGLAERAYELNFKAARVAREVADAYSNIKGGGQKRYVSGSVGPTTKLPSLGHISFGAMKDGYYEQVRGLVDGGVDVLQFETGQDLLQAKAAVMAMLEYFKKIGRQLPIITQVTLEAPPIGTMLVGTDISAALSTLIAFPVDVIGINCATGPKEMLDPVHYLCQNSPRLVSVLPNAGLPENVDGKTVYKLTPDQLAQSLDYFAREQGVNIVGGCCGTTPAHLARVVEKIGNLAPKNRQALYNPSVASIYTSVALDIDQPPLIVGERTNTNGSKKFKELLQKSDLDGMVSMAREQEREGAHILDVCTAYVGRDEVADMTAFVKRLNTELQIPMMLDSTEFNVLEEALKLTAGKAIVNSINLEDGEAKMVAKAEMIKRYGASAVALTIDEAGMAKTADKKLEVAKRIYDLATGVGLAPYDLIFDALTFTLSTGNEDDRKLGLETLKGIELIKKHLPGVKTILGVSNISFGFDPKIRRILNSVFLHYAVDAGLDMAIVNAQKILPLYKIEEQEAEYHRKLIFDERSPGYDPLFALLDLYKEKKGKSTDSKVKKVHASIEDALKQRIIDGERVGMDADLVIALERYKPLDIINNILLEGMKVVGELFGSGKMQLPFVLQSAETMKAAVAYLEPLMEKVEGSTRGIIILATVKGDVHDIGKNLCDIILTNNGYRVINLGIKQPIDNIINAAVENKADCIGMSGLLVKSTVIMKENLDILNQRSIDTPVILGGAALTRRYVEDDCRRVYQGLLFYGQDAFDDLHIMEALANKDEKGIAKMLGKLPSENAYEDYDQDEDDQDEQVEDRNKVRVKEKDKAEARVKGAVDSEGKDKCSSEDTGSEDTGREDTGRKDNGREDNGREDNGREDNGREDTSQADYSLAGTGDNIPAKKDGGRVESDSKGFITKILRSNVARGLAVPTPPFWGAKVLEDFDLSEVFGYLNENALIRGQFRVRQGETSDSEYQEMLDEKIRPMLTQLQAKCIAEKLLEPKAVYGYFPCQSSGNDLIVYHPSDLSKEWVRFTFPRQDFGQGLCISDFFASVDERIDVLPLQIATVGSYATTYAQKLFSSDKYSDYLYFHGLAVESAEALAEVVHKRIRAELNVGHLDAPDIKKIFQQGYSGTRYGFGYPACPNLEDQAQLFELLKPQSIGVELSEEYQLVPEQSTSALVAIHPEAKYFNVKRRATAAS